MQNYNICHSRWLPERKFFKMADKIWEGNPEFTAHICTAVKYKLIRLKLFRRMLGEYLRRMLDEHLAYCKMTSLSGNAQRTVQNDKIFRRMLGDWSNTKFFSENSWRLVDNGNFFSKHSPYICWNFQRLLTFAMHSRIPHHAFTDHSPCIRGSFAMHSPKWQFL